MANTRGGGALIVGVDDKTGHLIRIGSSPPLIEPTDSPAVRVVLGGRPVDANRYRFFAELEPAEARDDVGAHARQLNHDTLAVAYC